MKKYILLSIFLFTTTLAAQDLHDPFEPVNRAVFKFNDTLDIHLLEPIAREYEEALPDPLEAAIGNFFHNLRYPRYLVSDLVQFKFTQALKHTSRFVINSTVGLVGLFDPAKRFGLEEHEEDFGAALGYHGVPEGPYIVLPLFGPSNVRDTVGFLVDLALDPFFFYNFKIDTTSAPTITTFTASTLRFVDIRAGLLEAVEAGKDSSLDYYLFVQSAYHQHRQGVIYDGNPPDEWED